MYNSNNNDNDKANKRHMTMAVFKTASYKSHFKTTFVARFQSWRAGDAQVIIVTG